MIPAIRFEAVLRDGFFVWVLAYSLSISLALARTGEIAEAIEHLRVVVKLKPANANAHYDPGNALMEQEQFREALTHFTEGVRLNPADEVARGKLARLRGWMAADELAR